MFKKWIIISLTTAIALTACHSPTYNQAQGNVADEKIKVVEARHKFDDFIKPEPSVVVKDGSYVDTKPINLDKEPSWLKNHIVIRGDQLPFSYYSRTIASGANDTVLTKYQAGLDPSANISLNYSGSVKGALDLIAAKTGYTYTVSKNSIYWEAFVTRTFDIAFMPGDSDYLMGKKSGGTGAASGGGGGGGSSGSVSNYVSSDSSASEYSNLSAKLSVWRDLDDTMRHLLSDKGKWSVSQATTSITVRDRPSNIELVAKFIENLNKNLSKQVLVKIQVFEVNLTDEFDFGINWDLVARAFHKSPFRLTGNYGNPITITPFSKQPTGLTAPVIGFDASKDLPTGSIPSYTVLLNALNQQGHASVVSEPRVVCLNNQVSVVRIVTQEGYVASIQNTSTAATSSNSSGGTIAPPTVTSQVTPGTLITGVTLYILPKIMDNRIYLQLNADLSTNDAFGEFGPPNATIQLPHITEKSFNQKSMIKSGDTLVLSGFRQRTNVARANQLLNSQALGGKGSQQLNRETIVLITPIILDGAV